MVIRRRPADVGADRGRAALRGLTSDLRAARIDRGLSLRSVARAAGLSASQLSRLERGLVEDVGVVRLASLLSIVGLELTARAYPAGSPIRDAAHAELLRRFRAHLHRSLTWATEVPLPQPGDLRAWDAVVSGDGWRYGVEAETRPTDAQALGRRLQLKARDSGVDGVLLVLPPTRHTRRFLAAAGDELAFLFSVPGARALELLAVGVNPGGSAVIVC